jgi:hypothetical protein
MRKKEILFGISIAIIFSAMAGIAGAHSGYGSAGAVCSFCHSGIPTPLTDEGVFFKDNHKFDGLTEPLTSGASCTTCHTNLNTVFLPLTQTGQNYSNKHRYNDTTLAAARLPQPACGNCHVDVVANDFDILQAAPTYLKSSICENCHRLKYDDWYATMHRVMLTSSADGQAMDLPLPPGVEWENVSFMIVGKSSFRYLNESGYFSYEYNVMNQTFSPLNGTQYTCGSCHTTGYSTSGNQDGLPGIVGTWSEQGIACERCHGPAGNGHRVEVNASGYLCTECHSGSPLRLNTEAWKMSAHAPPLEKPVECLLCHSPFDYYENRTVTAESALNVPCATCHSPHDITDDQYKDLLSPGGFDADQMAVVKDLKLSFFNASASRLLLTGGATGTLTAGSDVYDMLTTPALISSGIDSSYPGPISVTGPVSEVLCSNCHYNHGLGGVGGVNMTHARLNYPGLGLEPATCTDCHMSGTQRNHSFDVKDELNFPSSTCSRGTECHVTSDQNLNHSLFSVIPVVNEWKSSRHNNNAFVEEGFPENTSRCSQCHSPINWNPLDASETVAPEDYRGVTCAICHNIHDMGDWLKNTGKPYAWYKRDAENRTFFYRAKYEMEETTTGLCTNCHQNRPDNSVPNITGGRGPHGVVVPHTSTQKEMFIGSVKESGQNFECADCHMFIKKTDPDNVTEPVLPDEKKITGHTFRMDVTGLQNDGEKNGTKCSDCHAGDMNLSGLIDKIQSDIKTKWNATNETLESVWQVYDTFTGEKSLAGSKLAEAFFKLYQVRNDESWGVHDPQKANDLLNDSLNLANQANESLGQVAGTFNITGYKINDTNGNGMWDAGETGLENWSINLINATTSSEIANTTTNPQGFYEFNDLPEGTYIVSEETMAGWMNTSMASLTVNITDQDVMHLNFTNNLSLIPPGDVSSFELVPDATAVLKGNTISITIRAIDINGTETTFAGSANITINASENSSAVTYPSNATFTNGTAAIPVTSNVVQFITVNAAADIIKGSTNITFADRVFGLVEGWNLVSIPNFAEPSDIMQALQNVKNNGVVGYDPATGLFSTPANLQPLFGYWINVTADNQAIGFIARKNATIPPPSRDLYEGWNLIGVSANEEDQVEMKAGVLFRSLQYGPHFTQWYYSALVSHDSGSPKTLVAGDNDLTELTDNTPLSQGRGYWMFIKNIPNSEQNTVPWAGKTW